MRRWLPLLAVCIGTFMLLVDVTIVTVALPAVSTALDASFASLQWVLDIYALLLAALVLAAGSASDRIGRKRIYIVGLVLFTVSSLACGLSSSIEMLIIARAVQGVGAAAMFATTIALIAANYSGRQRGIAFGLWGAVNGAAAASGPIVGGLLTEHYSWRAIFLVNLPVAVIALLVSVFGLSESRNPAAPRLDISGTIIFSVAVAAAVFGVINGNEYGWSDPVTLVSLDVAIVGAVVFVLIERVKTYPMLDIALMRTPSFAAIMFAALMLNGCAFANLAFVSVWLQSSLGLDPVQTGLVFMPLSITSFVVAAITGRNLHRLAPKLPVGIGLLLIGAGVLLQTRISPGDDWTFLVAGLIVTGLGVGMTNPALADAALAAAPAARAGMAGGATNTFRQLGYAIGIAVLGTVFSMTARERLGLFPAPEQAASVISSGQGARLVAAVPDSQREVAVQAIGTAFTEGLSRVFLVSGIGALIAGVVALVLVKSVRRPMEVEASQDVSTGTSAAEPVSAVTRPARAALTSAPPVEPATPATPARTHGRHRAATGRRAQPAATPGVHPSPVTPLQRQWDVAPQPPWSQHAAPEQTPQPGLAPDGARVADLVEAGRAGHQPTGF